MSFGIRALRTIALAGLTFAAACSTMPDERAEAPALPADWRDAPIGADVQLTDWWRQFNDPALDRLIAEALVNGPTVQIAALRVTEARAVSHSTITRYLPELNAIGRGQYTRAIEGPINSIPGAPGAGDPEQMTGSYGAEVSWEIPLFARIEAASVGGRANTLSAFADLRAARVALAADVAQAYVDYRAARESYQALSQQVAAADELARLLEISANAGITAPAEAADARRLAETARTQLPGFAIEARRAENVLAVLRGISPGTEDSDTAAVLAADVGVPVLPLEAAPAAPADLLRLRPDVVRAEAQALLAAANVADARANLLPRLNLVGAITVTDNIIGTSLPAPITQATATPLISIPLFDWGSRIADLRANRSRFQQSLIQYRQTVISAVGEASNALTALEQGRQRLQSARRAEEAAEATARGSRAAYDAGIQSLADRLQSDQQLIVARQARINAEQAQASAAIAAYRAFGGGPTLEDELTAANLQRANAEGAP
jgi:NodT family efflux transporter outer membrane factor (OMF) lipoprotein